MRARAGCIVNKRRLSEAIQLQENNRWAKTIPTIASPSHSWRTSPVKRTVCNAQTETNKVTSSQKVVFNRHCAGFADSRVPDTLEVCIVITQLDGLGFQS